MGEVSHRASIAIAKIKAAGEVPDTITALLAWIEELEAEADEADLEAARSRHIEEVAADVVSYHDAGRFGSPDFDEFWDANVMISKIEDLSVALSKEPRP